MKKYMLMMLIAMGLFGTTISFGQEGPKTNKKERKVDKKEYKMEKKADKGDVPKTMKKKEKAHKKAYKAEIKEEKNK